MRISVVLIFFHYVLITSPTAHADTFGSGTNQFDIEFVDVGNPNNPDDTSGEPNPAGKVEYAYRMGKFEISEQMFDKVIALGGVGNTKGATRGPDKPVTTYWWSAAQFVNWLNTSTGHSPAYKFSSTSVTSFDLWRPSDSGYDPANQFRNSQAFYFLPSVDEWYKAAYYDPNANLYYEFPTGSDSPPDGIDFPEDLSFDAVFSDGVPNSEPNDITNVGKLSPYGTAGQGGNVKELLETEYDLVNDNGSKFGTRILRGGDWYSAFSSSVGTLSWGWVYPNTGHYSFGFRVASNSVPEPNSLLPTVVAVASLYLRLSRNRQANRIASPEYAIRLEKV